MGTTSQSPWQPSEGSFKTRLEQTHYLINVITECVNKTELSLLESHYSNLENQQTLAT